MRQFRDAKKSHPDSIMLFRMGDFYETFEEDAIITSKILGIKITKIGKIISGKKKSILIDQKGEQILLKYKGYIHKF